MMHILKLKEPYTDAVHNEIKTFEVRLNDRGFQVGDIVKFQAVTNEAIPLSMTHPINDDLFVITYVHSGFGLKENYVVFGIKKYSS